VGKNGNRGENRPSIIELRNQNIRERIVVPGLLPFDKTWK
jgi:hypothetical protein